MKLKATRLVPALMAAGICCGVAASTCGESSGESNEEGQGAAETADTTAETAAEGAALSQLQLDSIAAVRADSLTRYKTLTNEDLKLVADELGIEVAAMKAVVSIEAGAAMEGFAAPGVPIVNFDPSMYRIYGPKAPSKAGDKNAKVPEGLSGYQKKEWTQLTNARHKNAQGADMGTFWGMFQIGGFNYKVCGCQSVEEFVAKMSESELAQLELFAAFLRGTGQLKYLQDKDWAKFARAYNGPSYARRGYHTKMANAYKRFKAEE